MPKCLTKGCKLYIAVIIAGIILDQVSKTYLISALQNEFEYSIDLMPFLKIVYAWNYGISFGLFGDYYQYSNYVFIGINIVITAYLIYLLKCDTEYNKFALSIIIGGALGNLVDRVVRGAVFDFIYLHYANYSFPAFNVADGLISLGAMIILIDFYRQRK